MAFGCLISACPRPKAENPLPQIAHFLPERLARLIGCRSRRNAGVAQAARVHLGEAAARLDALAPDRQRKRKTPAERGPRRDRHEKFAVTAQAVTGLEAH